MSLESTADRLEAIVRQAAEADRSARARVREVARSIEHDPGSDHGVERLADRAAMSTRNLQRLFVRATGLTPARFVERARVRLACRLLESTGLAIRSIALRCGFGSEERMRRAFHRVLGCSPREHARDQARGATSVPPMRYGADVRRSGSNWLRST